MYKTEDSLWSSSAYHYTLAAKKKKMKNYLKSMTGFEVPDQFVEIAIEFENRFGSKEEAIEKIGEYIGFEYVVNKDEVRGYEGVPFEAELPFATGSDGEHMGWLNIAPELKNMKKPFITWEPMGVLVVYHGTEMNKVIEGKVKYLNEDNNYEGIDLEFLSSIEINPRNGESIEKFINYETEKLEKIPISLKDDWKYEMTLDGVGVYAQKKMFAPNHEQIKGIASLENTIEKVNNLNNNGYPATSLFLIKNGISVAQFDREKFHWFSKLYELAIETYLKLGRKEIAEIVKNQVEK